MRFGGSAVFRFHGPRALCTPYIPVARLHLGQTMAQTDPVHGPFFKASSITLPDGTHLRAVVIHGPTPIAIAEITPAQVPEPEPETIRPIEEPFELVEEDFCIRDVYVPVVYEGDLEGLTALHEPDLDISVDDFRHSTNVTRISSDGLFTIYQPREIVFGMSSWGFDVLPTECETTDPEEYVISKDDYLLASELVERNSCDREYYEPQNLIGTDRLFELEVRHLKSLDLGGIHVEFDEPKQEDECDDE